MFFDLGLFACYVHFPTARSAIWASCICLPSMKGNMPSSWARLTSPSRIYDSCGTHKTFCFQLQIAGCNVEMIVCVRERTSCGQGARGDQYVRVRDGHALHSQSETVITSCIPESQTEVSTRTSSSGISQALQFNHGEVYFNCLYHWRGFQMLPPSCNN